MNKDRKAFIISLTIIICLVGIIAYLIFHQKNSNEILVRVRESYNGFSIVEPYHSKNTKYEVMQINVGDLNEGDIIKIKTNGSYEEIYPPVVKVEEYEYISNNTSTTTTSTSTTTTTTTTKVEETPSKNTTTRATTHTTTTTLISKDDIVINTINDQIRSIGLNKNNTNYKDKAKEYFTTLVDFIFYNEPIKGVYFKDLTNKAKLTIIKLGLKLDNLADKYYPNYKDTLSSKYQNIKSKLIELYLDNTSQYCANHNDVCSQAKQDFAELKRNYGITWEFIKDLGNKGWSKLKEWYEIYSGK